VLSLGVAVADLQDRQALQAAGLKIGQSALELRELR